MYFNIYAIESFINFTIGTIFAVLVFSKKPRRQKDIALLAFVFLVTIWNLFYFIWQTITDDYGSALFWARMLILPVVFIPASYYYLVLTLTDSAKQSKKSLTFVGIVSVIFFISDIFPYFIDHVEPVAGVKYWPIATPVSTIFWVWFSCLMGYSFYLLFKQYNKSSGVQRMQLKYFITGLGIAFLVGYFDILPWYKIPIPPILHILVSAYVVLIVIAIIRYRFMDIRVVARLILFYSGFSVILYMLFGIGSFLLHIFFGTSLPPVVYLLAIFIFPVVGIILYLGNEFLSNFLNRYIFKSLYNYQQATKIASNKLSHYASLHEVGQIVIDTIKNTLQPESVALVVSKNSVTDKKRFEIIESSGFTGRDIAKMKYIVFEEYFQKKTNILLREELEDVIVNTRDEKCKESLKSIKDEMQKYDVSVYVPLGTGQVLSGIIIAGNKLNNEPYSSEDVILLETLSYQAQIAVDNALLMEELEEKNKELQRALASKDDFIRIASHQLNTPLSIIRMAYSMVKDKTITQEEGMNYLGVGIKKIENVIGGIWDVLKSEEKIEVIPEKVDIQSVIEKSITEEGHALLKMNKKIKIVVEKPKFEVPSVFCSLDQIKVVVNNLLENAIYYTPKGSVTINYELIGTDNFIKVNIKDTGIGFSKEDKSKIGQKFYRTKPATLLHTDSSGLGVYLCAKIISDNGGKLSFDSEGEGKGATFSFTLPIYKEER